MNDVAKTIVTETVSLAPTYLVGIIGICTFIALAVAFYIDRKEWNKAHPEETSRRRIPFMTVMCAFFVVVFLILMLNQTPNTVEKTTYTSGFDIQRIYDSSYGHSSYVKVTVEGKTFNVHHVVINDRRIGDHFVIEKTSGSDFGKLGGAFETEKYTLYLLPETDEKLKLHSDVVNVSAEK